MNNFPCYLLVYFSLLINFGSAFLVFPAIRNPKTAAVVVVRKGTPNDDDNESRKSDDPDPLTKASWYGVEAFGKIFGSAKTTGNKSSSSSELDTDKPPASLQETVERIRKDNEREYFLSGQIDELIYSPDCTFSDPFVSFQGRDRFIDNLQNLGSFITKYKAKPIDYQVDDENTIITTKFMVKLQLNLPWKPILAWPWGVRCEIDTNTFLVTKHEESWDVAPIEGVKQIFRKPTVTI